MGGEKWKKICRVPPLKLDLLLLLIGDFTDKLGG